MKSLKDKTTRFLVDSLILVSFLYIIIFSALSIYMGKMSKTTLNEVGTTYMSSMSEKISLHFETTMQLRLSQVQALISTVPPEKYIDSQTLREVLAYNAKARGFDYLAFYSDDGSFDMVYGEDISLIDPEPFLHSLLEGKEKIAVAQDASGRPIVLLSAPSAYRTEDGTPSIALVAGLPVEYISKTLSLDVEDSFVYSHIIRRDGSFVIRGSDAFRDSYFERVRATYESIDGQDPDRYIHDLQEAMNAHTDYSSIVLANGQRLHIYCTPLAYSEWYLVTVMPYQSLDYSVNRLNQTWNRMTFLSCGLALLVLLLIFAKYFKLTRQQILDLEAAKEEAVHANHAKSEFLSNMSHDIRTPMNAIVGMTAIAIANFDNPQQVQNCLKKISLSSKHLLGLINDVLDMSKIESGKMTLNMDQLSLREAVENIVNIIQPQIKAKKQQFNVFIHDIFYENVYCDSVRLNQLLLNFLSNAIKFTPEGGSIHLALYEEPSPVDDRHIRVHISVKDNGIGMTQEFKDKIFDSFAREDNTRVHKTEGTGLGMTITKFIVDAMKGTIEVDSEQGKGSEFRVTLDLEKAEVVEADMVLPSWNMLVVDDDEQLCRSTAASLTSIGIQAEWTLDGETAIQMVKKRRAEHNDYHIILLDWKLPGMDGIQTAKEIRKCTDSSFPILLISAYDWSDIEEEARDSGIDGFIAKPLFRSTLYYSLKQYSELDHVQSADLSSASSDFHGMHVLLAEDNDLNWEIADELLSDLNLVLERAENGKICVEKFTASPVGFYKAIIMDIRMPVMTGYEAAVEIRKLSRPDSDIPIIAMTADAFTEDIQKCLACGMNAHAAKPIDVREIARFLEKFCNQ